MTKKSAPTARTSVDLSQPPPDDLMDWGEFDNLTNDDVRAAAAEDPDNPIMTAEFLDRMKRVPDVRAVRGSTGLSQPKFAAKYGISLAALREWEQGRRRPTQSARILLHVIHYEPDAVDRAILKARQARG